MPDTISVQQAVTDVAMIRKAIERAGGPSDKARRSAREAKIWVQAISLVFATGLAAVELFTGDLMTRLIVTATAHSDLLVLGVGQLAVALTLLVMCLYFIVWRSARRGEQDLSTFIADNFTYLRSTSLVADLLIKFIVFSLVFMAPRPEWLAPLLLVFTADLLFQGRYFNLPLAAALAAGVICIGLAGLQFFTGCAQLVWPLLVFASLNAASLVVLLRARKPEAP